MQLKVKHDSPTSTDYWTYPIYELDYDILSALSGFARITYSALNGDFTNYNLLKFSVTNNNIYTAFPQIVPTSSGDAGNIIGVSGNYIYDDATGNYILEGVNLESIPLGRQPDDWGDNPHYFYLDTLTLNGDTFVMIKNILLSDVWSSTTQYYKQAVTDNRDYINQLWFFDNGLSMSISKYQIRRDSNTCWRCCTTGYRVLQSGSSAGASAVVVPYALNDGTNLVSVGGSTSYNNTHTVDYYLSVTNSAALQAPYTQTQFLVHFVYSNTDYIGFVSTDNASGDNPYPTTLYCSALPLEMIKDNITSGGVPGQGNWGANAVVHKADGTFTAESDTRGTGTATDATQIAQNINFALQNKINAGYTVHRIDTSSDIALNLRNVKYFYRALFNSNFLTRFLTAYYNPLSSIINCILLPENLISDSGVNSTITASGFDIGGEMTTQAADEGTTVSGLYAEQNPITTYFVGSFDIDNYFGGYADFAPFTKCYLHLPYIGAQEIDINQIAHGKIAITYVCDVITGNVAAWIWCSDKDNICTYKYICTGNAAVTLKLAQNALSGNPLQAVSGALGALGGIASGNAIGAVTGAINAVSGVANAIKPSIQTAGQFGGDIGLISDSVCWIEFVRPQWVQPEHYQKINGIPSGISGTIRDDGTGTGYAGFLQIDSIDLDNVDSTDFEKAEIQRILQNGVYITSTE